LKTKAPVTSVFVTLIFAASFIRFVSFFFLSPLSLTLFVSLLLLKNITFVDEMNVSMMKNGIVNVEYSANVACNSKISPA
jgi:hypothetical protein